MRLLVAVLHREDLLDDVLSALVELEEPDAVVVESRNGLELLERDLPIFAGLRSLIPSGPLVRSADSPKRQPESAAHATP